MAYESKLYLVEKTSVKNEYGKTWAKIVAMYDLCNMGSGNFYNLFSTYESRANRDSGCIISIGGVSVHKDKYGSPLTQATVAETIAALKADLNTADPYRRIPPVLAMLEAIDESKWDGITVLHYGY